MPELMGLESFGFLKGLGAVAVWVRGIWKSSSSLSMELNLAKEEGLNLDLKAMFGFGVALLSGREPKRYDFCFEICSEKRRENKPICFSFFSSSFSFSNGRQVSFRRTDRHYW